MPINKAKGNMYGFIDGTFNIIRGKCSHDCSYCYMKRLGEQKPLYFDDVSLITKIPDYKKIFIGSSTDMFAEDVPNRWIQRVLNYCEKFSTCVFLFQTKNPAKFLDFKFREQDILCITLETNRSTSRFSKASHPEKRVLEFVETKNKKRNDKRFSFCLCKRTKPYSFGDLIADGLGVVIALLLKGLL